MALTACSVEMRLRCCMVTALWACLALSCMAALDCEQSGYCSLGKVQPWVGEVDSTSSLKAGLAARSFKQELVISIFGEGWLESHVQMYASMRALGLGHLLALTETSRACSALAALFPETGCGWSEVANNLPLNKIDRLYYLRHATAARAVRLGYNVLVIDADMIFFYDPYRYLKHPAMQPYNFVVQRESGHILNCGYYYVQNARPDGPTAFFLVEVVDRLLRYKDDEYQLLKAKGLVPLCVAWEQTLFTDVLSSMIIGQPTTGHWSYASCAANAANPQYNEVAANLQRLFVDGAAAATNFTYIHKDDFFGPAWRNKLAHFPGQVVTSYGQPTYDAADAPPKQDHIGLASLKWRVPRFVGPTPSSLGGVAHPPRGPLAQRFIDQIKMDDPAVPLWPDPPTASLSQAAGATSSSLEPSAPAEAAAGAAAERLLFVPHILLNNWYLSGRLGYWEPHDGYPMTPAMGHLHVVQYSGLKMMLLKYLKTYYWTLRALVQPNKPYVCSTDQLPVPKLVALHPFLPLHTAASHADFILMLRGLTQVAKLTGRAVLWPDVSCNASWTLNEEGLPPLTPEERLQRLMEIPLSRMGQSWHPYGQLGSQKCFDLRCGHDPCLLNGRGMTQAEFEHLAEQHGQQQQQQFQAQHVLAPGPHNVILEGLQVPNVDGGPEDQAVSGMPIMEVTSTELVALAMPLDSQPLLYLAAAVHVNWGPEHLTQQLDYQVMEQQCAALGVAHHGGLDPGATAGRSAVRRGGRLRRGGGTTRRAAAGSTAAGGLSQAGS